MPFDGNPEQFVKPGAISVDHLIAWLEKQNPVTRYSYFNPRDCLICRCSAALGGTNVFHKIDFGLLDQLVAQPHPWNYGAALERARALKATA